MTGKQDAQVHAISAYVPADWLWAMAAGEVLPERTNGAALFADISGFTPLTEAISRALGERRGAEQLSVLLNEVYDALIAEVDRYGGSVIGFAGDAITCWFAEELPKGSEGTAAPRATACAFGIQQAMGQFATIAIPKQPTAAMKGPTASVAVKVAVASGPARRFLVGDPAVQILPILAGTTMARMAAGECYGEQDEVLLDEPTVASLGGRANVREWRMDEDTGWRLAVVDGVTGDVAPARWPPPQPNALSDDQMRPWLLPAVFNRLRAGLGEFLTELRPAVALFLRFGGVDFEADPEAGAKLDAFVRWVQGVATRYDGTLIQVIVGDKGSYLYAAFGAPIAHEDDARRAVSAALELRTPPTELAFVGQIQIGISRGTMRTGSYGGSTRRSYAPLGDEANLAARLMQHAGMGEVLTTEGVRLATASDFSWECLPALQVKGKAAPVVVYRLVGECMGDALRLREPRYSLPIVGREAELALVRQKLDQALLGQGQIVSITAEAGLGKSRLVSELIALACARGLRCYGGECQSYGTSTPYLVWRSIWHAIFALDPAWSLPEQVRALEHHLSRVDPGLMPRVPLLGVLLNLSIPDNALTSTLDAKLRKASLEALLVDYLAGAFDAQSPLMLVLEDCHWLDPLSRDLLAAIGRAIAGLPMMIVVAYRPPVGIIGGSPGVLFHQLPNFAEVRLADFTAVEAERLVDLKLEQMFGGRVEVASVLLERITARAQGNPFYIEELLNYLHDRGIDPRDSHAIEHLDLPSSLHSLILSRIDQLGESQKITLKVASIIGRLFLFRWLWGVYPELGQPARVKADLDELSRLDLTPLDQPEPELSYLFKHIVTQEVAYESQAYAARAALHGQLGDFIEGTYRERVEQFVDLLAFHYDRGANQPKRREYLRKAGEAAQAVYANDSAIDYYQRVLPLLSDRNEAAVRLRLGQVLELVGQWDEADEQYRRALALASALDDRSAQARTELAIAWLLRKRGELGEAEGGMRQAQASFQRLGDHAGVSEVLAALGEICRLQGLYAEARAYYEESLQVAETVPERLQHVAARAQALKGAGTVASVQGDHQAARALYEESLAMHRELGNKPAAGILLNNLGIVARHVGELETARRLNDECLALFRELGDRWTVGYLLNNQGCVLADLGEYGEARRLLAESLVIGRQLGDKARVAYSLNSLADVVLDEGDYQAARPLLEESLTISLELGERTTIAYLLEDFGGVAAAQGQPERALLLGGCAATLREVNGAPLAPAEQRRVDRMLAPARQTLGEQAAAKLWAAGQAMTLDDGVAYARR